MTCQRSSPGRATRRELPRSDTRHATIGGNSHAMKRLAWKYLALQKPDFAHVRMNLILRIPGVRYSIVPRT